MNLQAQFYKRGDVLEFTAAADLVAGAPIEIADGLSGIVLNDVADGGKGVAQIEGIVKIVADNSTGNVGALIGWDNNGNPVGGTAGTGAATTTGGSMDFALGRLVGANKATGDGVILVKLGRQFATPDEVAAAIAAI